MPSDPELTPDFVDAVARRVLDLARRKLTVGDVAEIYGVHPTWVYARADQLGAFRLGSGPKAPLRFDPDKVETAFKVLLRPDARRAAERPVSVPPLENRPQLADDRPHKEEGDQGKRIHMEPPGLLGSAEGPRERRGTVPLSRCLPGAIAPLSPRSSSERSRSRARSSRSTVLVGSSSKTNASQLTSARWGLSIGAMSFQMASRIGPWPPGRAACRWQAARAAPRCLLLVRPTGVEHARGAPARDPADQAAHRVAILNRASELGFDDDLDAARDRPLAIADRLLAVAIGPAGAERQHLGVVGRDQVAEQVAEQVAPARTCWSVGSSSLAVISSPSARFALAATCRAFLACRRAARSSSPACSTLASVTSAVPK